MNSADDRSPVGERVVNRTADRLERDPLELEPLGAVVDPDLLRTFAVSDAVLPESELRFRYCGFEIRVSGTGEVAFEDDE